MQKSRQNKRILFSHYQIQGFVGFEKKMWVQITRKSSIFNEKIEYFAVKLPKFCGFTFGETSNAFLTSSHVH